MAFPTIQGTITAWGDPSGIGFCEDVTLPAGIQAGEALFVVLGTDKGESTPYTDIEAGFQSLPAGNGVAVDNGSSSGAVFAKPSATGSETVMHFCISGAFNERGSALSLRIAGHDTDVGQWVVATPLTDGSSFPHSGPNLSGLDAGKEYLIIACLASDSADDVTAGPTATNFTESGETHTGGATTALCTDTVSGVTSWTSPAQWQGGNEAAVRWAIAIPAPAAAPGRAARVTWAELEIPAADRAARVTWAELEIPAADRAARVTWAELETPDPPSLDRAARVTWAELEIPAADRAARVTWAELEIPAADRAARVTWAELEIPAADRAARVTWAELETPDPPSLDRAARVTWAELETPSSALRAARITWARLDVPDVLPTGVGAPPNEHGAELFVTVEDVTSGSRWDLALWDQGKWDEGGQATAFAPRTMSLDTRIGRARSSDPHRASSVALLVDARAALTRGVAPSRDLSVRFSPATGQPALFAFRGRISGVQDLLDPRLHPRATVQALGKLGGLARAKITDLTDPAAATTPATRAQAILDNLAITGLTLVNWPSTPTLYAGEDLTGRNALDELRKTAAAALGAPWITPDGLELRFLEDWPAPAAVPVAIGAGELLDPAGLSTDYSQRSLANHVTGKSPDPAVADYLAQDVVSQQQHWIAPDELTVPVTQAADLQAVVDRRLVIAKQPRREIQSVTVPIKSEAQAAAVLALELGTVLDVNYVDRLDPATVVSAYVRVEGIEHRVRIANGVREWSVTLRTDEARDQAGDPWTPL